MAIKALLCTFLLLIGFVLINTLQFDAVIANTNVSGIITTDTTWTKANSPYFVVSPLLVNNGVTLTIEPGVTVYLIDTYIRVDGTLNARGTPTNPISIMCNGTEIFLDTSDDSAIQFTSTSSSWNELTSSGSIIENAVVTSTRRSFTIYIDDASPKINNCTLGNTGQQRAVWISGAAPIISNCSITSNFAGISCGTGINNAVISDNVIASCYVGIEIYGGSPLVERNLIVNNYGNTLSGQGGIRIDYEGTSPLIRNNTIVGNTVGFNLLGSPSPTVAFNNILGNTDYSVHLYDDSGSDIDATSNWWGTIDVSAINQSIRDFKNDFNLGVVNFVPILDALNPYAPTLPITIDVEYSPSLVYANMEVEFDASASFGEYSNISNYRWDFGDGTVTSLGTSTATHTFTESGNYNVTLTVTDEFGFTNSTSTNIVVFQDGVPPVTSDDYDNLWHTGEFTINLTAIDSESGVAETYYQINDGVTNTVRVNGQPFINTESANNTLRYWSIDNAGNEETPKLVTDIRLDKTAPVSTITTKGTVGNNEWFTTDITVSVSATDAVSQIQRIEYSLDNANWETYVAPFTITDEATSSIYYRSVDNAGNVETAKTVTVKLDKNAPFGSILINENASYTNSMTVTLTLSADDTTSGVAQMRFSNDGTEWSNWETYSTSKVWTVSHADGTKTVYVQFKDNAGLVSESYQDTIILDTTAPAADAGQDQKVKVDTPVTFDANASSDNVGIVSYSWDFGDGSTGTGITATHTYYVTGTHQVLLTVEDAAGNLDTAQITVTVVTPELFPLWLIPVVAAVVILVVAVAVFFMKKRKRSSQNA